MLAEAERHLRQLTQKTSAVSFVLTSCLSQLLEQEEISFTPFSWNQLLQHNASFIVLTFVYYIIISDVKVMFISGRKTLQTYETSSTVEEWSSTWDTGTPEDTRRHLRGM